MKIGLIIYGSLDTVSGGYLYDRKLVEYLRARGDTVEIISLPWRNYTAHLMDNLSFRLPLLDLTGSGAKPSLQARKYDILIQDELNHPSLIAANQGIHPYPIVSLVHHLRCSELRPAWQNAFYRMVEKKYLQSVDGFIFNSRTTQDVVNSLIGNHQPNLVAYPPTDRFGEAISEREITERAQSRSLRMLFLGNVIYRKGLHTLLKSVNELVQRAATQRKPEGPKLIVDVVGGLTSEPRYAYEMERYVLTHSLYSIVTFHGALDNQPLVDLYKQAHVLVVPSSYEGFGIVYLEGMGFGLPAIGTREGGASEIITHNKDGFLIQPDDAIALADHLQEVDRDRELLVRLSLSAVQRYKSQPKWNETAKNIREFLYGIVKGNSPEAILSVRRETA